MIVQALLAIEMVAAAGIASAEPPSATAAKAEQTIVLQDGQPYFQGSYAAYASPWSTLFDKSLVRGKHYHDTITLRRSTFPDGTVIDTRWPTTRPEKSGVWGYHAVSYGNYDGGHPPKRVVPRQVKTIHRLSQDYAFSYEGSPAFNLLTEFYLTARAGDAAAKVIEVGFFLHAPEVSMQFMRGSDQLGFYRERSGREWRVSRAKNFVMLTAPDGADRPRGRINMLRALAHLVRIRVIAGDEWFNGIAFGTEPVEGARRTRVRIHRWRVDYQ